MSADEHDERKDPPSGTPDGATVVSLKSTRARARSSKRPPSAVSPDASHASATSGSRSVHTGATPISTTHRADVMRGALIGDEITRAHGFAGTIAVISAFVLVLLPLLGGNAIAKLLCAIALSLICLGSIVVFVRTRDAVEYELALHRLYGITITSGVLAVEYYCGVFSPVALIVTLGLYFLGQSSDPFQALGLTIYAGLSYLVLAALITFGVVADAGLFDGSAASFGSHLFAIAAVGAVFGLTVRMARVSRTSMQAAIERSNEAMQQAQQREDLLVEAQQQLERALVVAVGKPGLNTGKLAGPYRLGIVIGVGAMGEIYEATHEPDGTRAAVKLMQANAQERADLVQRFEREAAICRRLNDPHIVRVFDVGTLDNGASYMAMELLSGSDLAAHLRKHGAMPLSDVVRLAKELAAGLSHAHAAGVVHRDLKPVNVFLANDEEHKTQVWKILDFGISKLVDSTGTLTNVGIVGTPGYMSPEQAQGHNVDSRSDVFSMCVILYRALTGRPAFTGADTPQIMFEVVYKSPLRPSATIEALPPEVDAVFAIGLAKNPDERWATPTELANALELAAVGKVRSEWKARARKVLKRQPWGHSVRTS